MKSIITLCLIFILTHMGDLTIIEKYPNSLRINHADSGEVFKTTYAKGVITDFEVVSTSPFQVRSLVKVSGDFGESDYIPLFFHPKPEYWDNTDALATDFNEEGKYFEKAWMSFRCGDEVSVLLNEGTPKAVIGFYDGVPRVGEDIIKLEANRDASWINPAGTVKILLQCSKKKIYSTNVITSGGTFPYSSLGGSANETGPDGSDLNLVAAPIYVHDGGRAAYPWQITYYLQPGEPGYTNPWVGSHYYPELDALNAYLVTGNTYYYYKEFFVTVGPILYIFQVNWVGGDCSNPKDLHPPLSGVTPYNVMMMSCRSALYSETYLDQIKGMGLSAAEVGAKINDPSNPYWATEYPNSNHEKWVEDEIAAMNSTVLNWLQTLMMDTGINNLNFYTRKHNPE